MFIKRFLTRLWEKKTGRKCSRCKHNRAGHCTRPSDGMYMKCWHSITRPGYTGRFERANLEKRRKELQPLQDMQQLSTQEQHELQKIKDVLQMAADTAKDGGLVED